MSAAGSIPRVLIWVAGNIIRVARWALVRPGDQLAKLTGGTHDRAHSAIDDDQEGPDAPPIGKIEAARTRIQTVGAWAGSASLSHPARDVAAMVSAGINRADIIVNDHSAWRKKQKFSIRTRERLIRLAGECHASGIDVHLMSWIMPHREYLEDAAKFLIPLMDDTGANSLIWDAEEPFTQARNPMNYSEVASLVASLFAGRKFEMGVTGIRYAPRRKLGPLIAVCDYAVPQCYSTSTSKADPSTVVSRGVRQWRDKFGEEIRIVPALAAYRQTGIRGHSAGSAMRAAIDDAQQHSSTVIYWGINSIRRSPDVTRAIAGIRDR